MLGTVGSSSCVYCSLSLSDPGTLGKTGSVLGNVELLFVSVSSVLDQDFVLLCAEGSKDGTSGNTGRLSSGLSWLDGLGRGSTGLAKLNDEELLGLKSTIIRKRKINRHKID